MPPPPAMPSMRYPASCEPGSSDATGSLYTGGVPEGVKHVRHAAGLVEARQEALRLATAAERPQSLLAVLRAERRQGGEPAHSRAGGGDVDCVSVGVERRHELVDARRRRQ